MRVFGFTDEVLSNEDAILEVLDSFLPGKMDLGLRVKCGAKTTWELIVPDNVTELPKQIGILGKFVNSQDDYFPKYWITRKLVLEQNSAVISGTVLAKVSDLPIEEIIKGAQHFTVEFKQVSTNRVPNSRVETVTSVIISTDNFHIAQSMAKILNGKTGETPKSTIAYTSELKFFIRPPISTHSFNSSGVLSSVPSVNRSFGQLPQQITKHCLICGKTGSGKTNTARIVLDQLLENNSTCHTLILDNKGEYKSWAQKHHLPYLEVGKNPLALGLMRVNPFIPGKNVRLVNHLEILSIVLSVSGFSGSGMILPEYMKLILYKFMMKLWGVSEEKFADLLNLTGKTILKLGYTFQGQANESIPKLLYDFWQDFMLTKFDSMFSNTPGRSLGDLKGTLSARFTALRYSPVNHFTYHESANPPDDFLSNSYVLSFQGISQNHLTLLTSLIAFLYCECARMMPETDQLNNILLIEEAHLVLQRAMQSAEVITAENALGETFERMLAELRSRGVGMILVDQSPSRLVQNVIANTGTKIAHQLTLNQDITEISESIGLPNANEFQFLPTGHCFSKFDAYRPQKEVVNLWSL